MNALSQGYRGKESNAVDGDSYTSRASRTAGLVSDASQIQRRPDSSVRNDMLKCPRTALFAPSCFTSARSVFDAFKNADIDASDVQCLQCKMNSEVVITFKSLAAKEKFVSLNAITFNHENYAIQDIDRPLTFLTVYNTSFKLSDWAIVKGVTPFCEVVHYGRGRFDFMPSVYNSLRHYRVRVIKPIPSFLCFGRYQLFLEHDGQHPTCHQCV